MASVFGDTPERLMPYVADGVLKQNTWQLSFTVGNAMGSLRPLLVLSPILAQTIAQDDLPVGHADGAGGADKVRMKHV